MTKISYGIHRTEFGKYLILITNQRNICFGAFVDGENTETLLNRAKKLWPEATIVEDQKQTEPFVQKIFDPRARDKLAFILTGTPFQKNVWEALLGIREGEITTYASIAQQIGRPTAVRAVANAIANNNISVLIPCHRVVGSSGALCGYRWGIARKKALILNEQHCKE